jgi:hypothetical protein
MEKAKGAQGNPGGRGAPIVQSSDATAQPKTLSDLGISKQQSSNWQKLAAVPEETFEQELAQQERPTKRQYFQSNYSNAPSRSDPTKSRMTPINFVLLYFLLTILGPAASFQGSDRAGGPNAATSAPPFPQREKGSHHGQRRFYHNSCGPVPL